MDNMSMVNSLHCKGPEIWGGLECTINRVNNSFRDQLHYTGHYTRPGDVEAIASLGIKKLRYPILWEKHQPAAGVKIDWRWILSQLENIRNHHIQPIIGLLHHGSGPHFTNLLDPQFPEKLAGYAGEVAKKIPWLEYYTPVNEPLTTARFSGLYGLWYPHHTNELSCIKMLLNQVKGIILSMKAIRKINPQAKLVQTEDLSITHSTPMMSYQAEFENRRRWLTYDLLCGLFNEQHFFWNYFKELGIATSELHFFKGNSCVPEIMGFNYYVTSERFLDEKIDKYPACYHGGNGTHRYADLEAVRAMPLDGAGKLLTEAWTRYGVPLAITECHLNCTREEQLRWFYETWKQCKLLNEKGIMVKAITAWSLLGACDWNTLLTSGNNYYETGVFDVRDNMRRPTALAKMIGGLTGKGEFDHPLLLEKGWWNKDQPLGHLSGTRKVRPLLITGGSGTLGQAFIRICKLRSIPFVAPTRQELDISDEQQVIHAIDQHYPWAIINTAGYVRVDDAEINYDKCFAANATGPQLLSGIAGRKGIRFMSFSSDLVFDGDKREPYNEFDEPGPLNIYGQSKIQGEKLAVLKNRSALIIRTSAFFGPWDKFNFVQHILTALKDGRSIRTAADIIVSPTYVPDLVNTALDLLIDEAEGVWHLSNEGSLSWADFANEIAMRAGYDDKLLEPISWRQMEWQAKRPLYSVLQSEKGIKLPTLEYAIERFFEEQAC